jgi:signal transduction histidine kinase
MTDVPRGDAPIGGAPAGDASPIDLAELILVERARIRHDLSNPLTAAMTETELLLMDVERGELRDGLERVLSELNRVRDVLQDRG